MTMNHPPDEPDDQGLPHPRAALMGGPDGLLASRGTAVVSDGFNRVTEALAKRGHPHEPIWLTVPVRTSQEAADHLGVQVGQIAKSVIFRKRDDDTAVLVIASGDKRVDEKKIEAVVGPIGRADAEYVKDRTGFSIGGVAPLAHLTQVITLIDRELFRFPEVWAAAGHPNGVFRMTPDALVTLTGAPVQDVVQP